MYSKITKLDISILIPHVLFQYNSGYYKADSRAALSSQWGQRFASPMVIDNFYFS